jgi:hypothetical protein
LIVIGGGISGLAAAYFYRARTSPSARILILDNHDDFGGHAKRNEIGAGGRLLLANGGTLAIESPYRYSPEARGLMTDLGVDPAALQAKCADRNVYRGLGPGGFDPARDIAAITVNRWPHGYAYEYNALWDPDWPEGQRPCEVGRKRFGRIAIANSDAAAAAYTGQAMDRGYRAVQELLHSAASPQARSFQPGLRAASNLRARREGKLTADS